MGVLIVLVVISLQKPGYKVAPNAKQVPSPQTSVIVPDGTPTTPRLQPSESFPED
jgi:hypothetical protein